MFDDYHIHVSDGDEPRRGVPHSAQTWSNKNITKVEAAQFRARIFPAIVSMHQARGILGTGGAGRSYPIVEPHDFALTRLED